MSKLEFYGRPLVAFDAGNSVHRSYYYEFVKGNGWGKCPVRFICPESTGMNLVSMIQQAMLDYYVTREFEQGARLRTKTVVTKPQKLVSQKKKKTVDSKRV
jgi:hypothetical protein